MNVYLAARFSKRHILQGWAIDLENAGFNICSRWSKRGADHMLPPGLSEQAATSERIRFAREDLEDLHDADIVISLMEEPRNTSRGGRHVEFGYALAMNKQMFIIGPKETVFHELPSVYCFNSWGACFENLRTLLENEND